ncbi:unnamed protein product [Urochloa humidicola]
MAPSPLRSSTRCNITMKIKEDGGSHAAASHVDRHQIVRCGLLVKVFYDIVPKASASAGLDVLIRNPFCVQ